ncbi:MAG: hypothetical protein KME57_26285 [Scytonema hyalinum WJT4-NPBG1]|jgi:plasmid maintenance system antidote protein VapI|nr:hypothetical protein [Scytonema hyalinum WJT4-NPBG1]
MQENMINFRAALAATMKEYGIKGTWLASRADITPQTISQFICGRCQIKIDTLERLINALPPDAQEYFFFQMKPIGRDIISLARKASDEEKAEVLRVFAASYSRQEVQV